ncbi:alkaline ceramidase 3 [Amborella trichopoda]|uniref:alkaline ceramidase 3 n=1 Tax=Amborella trichopoda TaxID=13333 RepID=UPI0005D3CD11|nr:alkaline ceramidase 3 [Amborella trichopoda]XP_011621586.1 alkaline ceramidase 3 [Amborella trichopoda]XP_011621587.1 alkaline ceramidase 3 [Amborella trichopoda]XP_020520117.1 alkaline ceramidase 3 [Amborella trichopoda]XP_020520118.1 alkaline ceramidase 3 [Amborella trichopoda]XP_020520119.1 alkaline ceramidase 3 [Amborella trichopoda]|eukprot:XP_011621585.1 alkaline ceramidase 3 [Amborella trichopoda]
MTYEMASSFWGPVTSTTEWCEENYAYSSYIAEFFNTISNIPCILLAFIGLINALRQRFEKRFSVLHISNIILSIGSMLYHASLQHVQQQSDETPMVWEVLLYMYVLYSPDWHYRSTMPTFLFLYGAAFAILHSQVRFRMGFKVHYALLCLLCVPRMYKYYIYTREASAKRLAHLFVATILLASMCWLLDRSFCEKISKWSVNPQGHALWHVLMGFNSYFANTFLMFCRAQQLGWGPQVKYFLGLLPYVKINKPKAQ